MSQHFNKLNNSKAFTISFVIIMVASGEINTSRNALAQVEQVHYFCK